MRTGSNLLEKTLGSLGETVSYGEPFNPSFIGVPKCTERFGWDCARRSADPLGFLAVLRREADGHLPGFRIFDGHDEDVARHALADPDCRRIVLRRDPVDSYISLKIARETGQWMLKDPNRRIALRATFDGPEFDAYRQRVEAHYAWLDQTMAEAGTSAFRVSYDQLSDRKVLGDLARFIGVSGTLPDRPPIVRQNPPRASEKVINPAEMWAWLGREPEPEAPPSVVPDRADDVLLPPRAPLAYAPIDGPGFAAGVSILYRFEQRAFGGPSLSYSALLARAAAGTLYPRLGDDLSGIGPLAARQVFTITCHPALRASLLFEDELFGPGWLRSPIRRRLIALHGDLPSPKELREDGGGVSPEQGAAWFLSFLDIVRDVRAGTGPVAVERRFMTQSALLAAYRAVLPMLEVVPLDALAEYVERLATAMGVAGLPPSHVQAVVDRATGTQVPVGAYRTGEAADALAALDGDDFEITGAAPWPALWDRPPPAI